MKSKPLQPFVVIATDQAKRSGYCIATVEADRTLVVFASGVCESPQERQRAVAQAVTLAQSTDPQLPIVALLECHRAGYGSKATHFGLGRAFGQWSEQLALAGITDIQTVRPQAWRYATLQLPYATPRAECKAAAVSFAERLLGAPIGEDESEAIGLASYAAQNLKPKRPRAKVT